MRGFRLLANEDGGLNKDTFRTALAFFDQKAGYESIHAMAKSRDLPDHLFDVFVCAARRLLLGTARKVADAAEALSRELNA